jgi:hypothetical protein
MKGYDTICKPPTQLLKEEVFNWNEETIKVFKLLKKAMTKPTTLALYNLNKPFIIKIDASGTSFEVILMQEGHPYYFIIKSLRPPTSAINL